MLFSVEQAFVGRDEKRAPLKTPAWEATKKTAKTCLSLTTVRRLEMKDVLKETGKLIEVLICFDK